MPAVPVVVNSVGMAFAPIPAGTFLMGNPLVAAAAGEGSASWPVDETPVVPVRITRPFFMGVFPLTCGQASKSGKATWRRHSSAQDYHPSTGMTWKQATTFCKKLSGLPAEKRAGRTYRLPTEAEWEYACRGPHAFHTEFNQGNRLVSGLFLFENLDMNELAFAGEEPLWAREGQHAPNAWGLYDMHGNVYEWCQDFYNAEAYEMLASELALQKGDYAEDPVDDWHDDSAYRVIRGGSAISDQYAARSSFRNLDDGASDHIGLRVVMIQE
jgi:formylglycine-generating enzyme required for sulfatase activity